MVTRKRSARSRYQRIPRTRPIRWTHPTYHTLDALDVVLAIAAVFLCLAFIYGLALAYQAGISAAVSA